jgi:hypothetical protein
MCLVHVVQEKQFQAIKTKFDFYYKDQINSQNGFWFKIANNFIKQLLFFGNRFV